jgi:hypothetical protein
MLRSRVRGADDDRAQPQLQYFGEARRCCCDVEAPANSMARTLGAARSRTK